MNIMKFDKPDEFLNEEFIFAFCKHYKYLFKNFDKKGEEDFKYSLKIEIELVKKYPQVKALYASLTEALAKEKLRKSESDISRNKKENTSRKGRREIKKHEKEALAKYNLIVAGKLFSFYKLIRDYTVLGGILELAFRIALLLPVTSADCERSFSNLKRIKTYLRSSLGMEKTSMYASISIHSKIAKALDRQEIVKSFANKTTRRSDFGYTSL
jgi:hypothetical protein